MRVMITGHLGFIGPIIIGVFKEAGHHITGLDVGYFSECIDPSSYAIAPDREIHSDIREVKREHFEDIDCIVHLAAISNDPMGELNPDVTVDVNYEATLLTARLAKAAGVGRFVFASSCSMYGAAGQLGALDETAELNPVSAYAVSKTRAEDALTELADARFCPVFMRNATAFGVSPRMRFDLVLNNLFGVAKQTGVARVLSDGTPWRPIVHIEDISRAALCAAEADRDAVYCEAFNIGSNDMNFQVSKIAQAVADSIKGCRVEITSETGPDKRSYQVDFTKVLTKLPGFETGWTLEKGCNELLEWCNTHDLAEIDLTSRHYVRMKQLRHLIDTDRIDAQLRWP